MKKGFTLVELLAVIVILSVILVIAVPKINSTISSTKESAFIAAAKLIAKSAETEYKTREMLNTLDQVNDPIECADVSNTTEDYSKCKIRFDNGVAKVDLNGTDKFEGLKNVMEQKMNQL